MNAAALWIILLACPAACLFTAAYLALKTLNRARLQELMQGRGQADRFERLIAQLPKLQLMTGTLRTLCNMVVVLAVLFLMQRLYPHWQLWAQYASALFIGGVLVSAFSVAIPTPWSRYKGEELLASTDRPLLLLLRLFMPFANLLHLADPLVRRISGAAPSQDADEELSEELISVVEEHAQGEVDPQQRQMIEAVVEFRSTTVGQVMTPRTEMVGLEVSATVEEIKHAVIEQGFSRLPVYAESLDHIVGVLYARDLIGHLGTDQPVTLRQNLREALMVPESKPVKELLSEFKQKKVHIAIVLDEYGGTAGLVTIEDIVEEIVGDIEDEYEKSQAKPSIVRVSETVAEVDGRAYIDDINDALGLALPESEDYDTLGGFVFATLGHVPGKGESFEHSGVKLTVIAAERTRVVTVRIEKHLTDESGAPS